MLYLAFFLMIMETIVQPCRAQKSQGEKYKALADARIHIPETCSQIWLQLEGSL